jgi:acylphosphatase
MGGGSRPEAPPEEIVRVTAVVAGRVQGVGFRWWVRGRALELGLAGRATNLDDGRVEVLAQGRRDACVRLVAALSDPGAPGRVAYVTERWAQPVAGLDGFDCG